MTQFSPDMICSYCVEQRSIGARTQPSYQRNLLIPKWARPRRLLSLRASVNSPLVLPRMTMRDMG